MGLNVALVFGGASVEHEVSLVSARGVLAGLERAGIAVSPIAVTHDGRLLPPRLSEPILRGESAEVAAPETGQRVLFDPGAGRLAAWDGRRLEPVEADAVFCLIHGWGGEDGRIQGALELSGVPYVGAGVRGSALGMDKQVSKTLFERYGLPVGPWVAFGRNAWIAGAADWHRRIAEELRFPVFVKPANGGSSVGVSKVGDGAGLTAAIEHALGFDDKVVVEAGLDAREIEVAVLGNDEPEASVPGEIVPSNEFYDYAAKYQDGTSELRIPAPLDAATTAGVRRLAVEAFSALDLSGMARVDFFVERASGRVLLNEVNTLPGFTPISMFPKLWEASGLAYPDLLERLVRLALERSRAGSRRALRR